MKKVILQSIGKKIGKLKHIEYYNYKNGKHYIKVICECGNNKIIRWDNFIKGKSKSCGCGKHEIKNPLIRHPLYSTYHSMKRRCFNSSCASYKYYGAKGVRICDEWLNDFKAFYDWAIANGWKKGLQIDKDIKGNGLLYSPESCCIVPPKDNVRIKKDVKISYETAQEIRNSNMTIKELVLKHKVNYGIIYRIKKNITWN